MFRSIRMKMLIVHVQEVLKQISLCRFRCVVLDLKCIENTDRCRCAVAVYAQKGYMQIVDTLMQFNRYMCMSKYEFIDAGVQVQMHRCKCRYLDVDVNKNMINIQKQMLTQICRCDVWVRISADVQICSYRVGRIIRCAYILLRYSASENIQTHMSRI